MNKWIRMIALALVLALTVQCLPVQAAALLRDEEPPGTQVLEVETEQLPLQPILPEEPQPTEPAQPTQPPSQEIQPMADTSNFTWTLENGVLTISGTGPMPDYSYLYNSAPWYEKRSEVTTVVVEEGITALGSDCFYNLDNLTAVTLPRGLTTVGDNAFALCYSLTEITLPDSLTSIGEYAFSHCGSLTEITLPDSLTSIGWSAFLHCNALTEITLPDSLTSIGAHAFRYCDSLTEITIPDSVTTIGSYAFGNCTALAQIDLPDSFTSIETCVFERCTALAQIDLPDSLTSIGAHAFRYCDSLTEITIPDLVTTIGEYAFSDCNALTEITLPDSLTSIGAHAFRYCDSLTQITLPDSLTSIGESAFSGCDSLTEITLPDSLTSIGEYAFSGCDSLTEITLPDSLTSIGWGAFSGCDSLTEITIPDSVTTIGGYAFADCTALAQLDLPDSLTSIEMYVFSDCDSLTEITLPDSLTSIEWYAFSHCDSLTEITIPDSVTTIGYCAFENCTALAQITILDSVTTIGGHAFSGCTALAQINLPDSLTSIGAGVFERCTALAQIDLPDSLTSIGEDAFRYCDSLTEITIPDLVTTIGSYAFSNCTALAQITLPDSLTSIEWHAFSDCDSLTEITIPDLVTTIENSAFSCCDSLTEITIPDSVTTIGYYAFGNCTALAQINLPDSLTSIGEEAFSDCDSLTEITIPDSVTSIGYSTFYDCTALAQIDLPDSLTSIGEYAFTYCNSLTEVTIPDSVTTIGGNAFAGCTALAQIDLPDSLTSIGRYVFSGCDSLTEITIPDSVTTIGVRAFSYCNALTEITIPDSVTTIGEYAFWDCDALTEITIPDSVTTIGEYAFWDCDALTQITLSDSLTSIERYAFWGCDSLTEITIPDSVTTIGGSAFAHCSMLEKVQILPSVTTIAWDAFTVTSALTFYAFPGSYAWTYAIERGIRLVDIGSSLTMTVLDETGAPITEGVTIEWYEGDSDEVLATGSTLLGVNKESLDYDYAIRLDEALSLCYHQPNRTPVVIQNENYDLTRTLEPIASLTLSGRVTDESLSPLANAALTLTQTYNGCYEKTITAVTAADGSFRVTADAVPTRIWIEAEGFYSRTANLDLSEKKNDHTMAAVSLSSLPKDKITLSVELVQAHLSGQSGLRQSLDQTVELEYTVYNVTRGRAITDFTVQLPWLILGEDQAYAGDTLRISAADPQGAMTADSITLTLDENRMGEGTILFRQNGQFRLSEVSANGQTVLTVFDREGELVYSCVAGSGYTGRNLPAGDYTLVLMEQNDLLRGAPSLELLDRLGLTAGKDYSKLPVTICQGLITVVDPVTVLELNEELIRYIDPEQTLLQLSPQKTIPERMITLRLSYAVDSRYASSGETVRLTLPEHVKVLYSVYLGSDTVPYTMDGRTMVIPVHAPQGEISLYISAEQVGSYSISAMLAFRLEGAEVFQPLGQTELTATITEISVPQQVNETTVPVNGVTMPNRQVQVYADDVLVAATTSNAVGSWSASVPLSKTYTYSWHEIRAEVAGAEEEEWHRTDPQYVYYDCRGMEVSTVTMIYGGRTTVFDFQNPDSKLYYSHPGSSRLQFSFRVRFTEGDDSLLQNVCLLLTDMNGDAHRVPCVYDEASDSWLAVYVTNSTRQSPASVGVCYDISYEMVEAVLDAERVNGVLQELNRAVESVDEEMDAIKYVDDGSLDGLDVYQLSELMDQKLDAVEESLDEAEYCYESCMEQMPMTFSQNGETFSLDANGVHTDSTVIHLEEVDEEELLAEGYELTESTDGSCVYHKTTGNTSYFVDPATMTLTMISYVQEEAAAPMASNQDDLDKALDQLETVLGFVERLLSYSEEVIEFLEKTDQALREEVGILKEQLEMAKHMSLLLSDGRMESLRYILTKEDYDRLYDQYLDKLERLDKLNKALDKLLDKLQQIRGLKSLLKSIPLLDIMMYILSIRDNSLKLTDLRNQLPRECPGDPYGLQLVELEIADLARFIYTASTFDLMMSIMSNYGIISIGFFGAGASFGLSVAIAFGVCVAKIALDVVKSKLIAQHIEGKIQEIEAAIRDLDCAVTDPEPGDGDGAGTDPEPGDGDGSGSGTETITGSEIVAKQTMDVRMVIDPSGYVYEAVPSNRLEGVKAEIYYRDGEQDVLWDAADYDQVNPYYTDADGYFHWDVPMGLWLVKFSKDGYYDTDSRRDPAADEDGYLPVPPPQMEVNTAMVSTAAPTVRSVKIYQDEVLLIFSQYMQPQSVNGDTVILTMDGRQIIGTISPSDAEWNYEQTDQYATIFRFVPEETLSAEATITVDDAVNYAGNPMTQTFTQTQTVTLRPETLLAKESVSMVYGTEYQLEVQLLPAAAGAGMTITAQSAVPALLRVDTPTVTADETGKALITVFGVMPGYAELDICLEGTDLEIRTDFTISLEEDTTEVCEKVTASIPSGSEVTPGTKLSLTTATEGAEIYYTLDGTCPCVEDSPSRIRYTGPITLTEDTFLIAYAVKEGLEDSPTAGFLYTVKNPFTDVPEGSFYYEPVMWAVENGVTTGTSETTFSPAADCNRAAVVTFLWRAAGSPEPVSDSHPFVDVEKNSFYEKAVLWAVENGVTNGTDATHFDPAGTCNRAQVVTFLYRAQEDVSFTTTECPFTDVAAGVWYEAPILWAVENGVTNGMGDGTFGVGTTCNRAQVVTFLYRTYET